MPVAAWMFVGLGAGLCLVFVGLIAYGMIADLRRGNMGILMGVLAIAIVLGLAIHDALAIVAAILFAAAWIIAALQPVIHEVKKKRDEEIVGL